MFGHIPKPSLTQSDIIANYNLLVDALRVVLPEMKLKNLVAEGACHGMSYCYKLFSHQGYRNEYVLALICMKSFKTKEQINDVISKYMDAKNKNAEFLIKINDEYLSFEKIIKIMQQINDAQSRSSLKEIGVLWDKSYSFICQQNNLEKQLRNLEFKGGESVFMEMGHHVFYIEKSTNGFYLLEPNNIDKSAIVSNLANEHALSVKILNNAKTFISNNSFVGFSLKYISYPSQSDQYLENAIDKLGKDELDKYPAIESIYTKYRNKKMSRLDCTQMIHNAIQNIHDTSNKFLEFKETLKNIVDAESKFINMQFNYSKEISYETAYRFNISLLWLATDNNQILLVNKLLNDGVSVNISDEFGRSPLHIATLHNHPEIVELLMSRKELKVNIECREGTPLYMATRYGHEQVALMLLKRPDIDVNHESKKFNSPLMLAIKLNRIKIFKAMIEHPGININHLSVHGGTPLHFATQLGHKDMVDLLLNKNAIVDIEIEGSVKTLMAYAEKKNRKDQLAALVNIEENPDKLPHFTPLHLAICYGQIEIVKSLLAAGADVNKKAGGISCMEFAKAMGHDDITLLLQPFQEKISSRKLSM